MPRPNRFHETSIMQKNSGIGEDTSFDFKVGDRVMTVDGIPGKVTALLSGPYQATEAYEVRLDKGMGGGEYSLSQLKRISGTEASLREAAEITASLPVEATTTHTADQDYPELGSILYDRLPNERLGSIHQDNEADTPDDSMEDSAQKIDQNEDETEEPKQTNENTDKDAGDEPQSSVEQQENNLPDISPPDACSFCGHDQFEDPQLTGRGARARCSQCGGTMKSWGGQWEPEAPNSPQNQASGQWDIRSGGPGGVVQAPGANYKSTSLHHDAGLVSWIVDRLYDKIQDRNEHRFTGPGWADQGEWQQVAGPEHTEHLMADNCAVCNQQGLAVHGSVSELSDPEWTWHFTASWTDVQAKARRLRKEGHVKIVSANNTFVAGEVQGDHAVYESELNYVPGTKHIANWSCGCKWASYTWGRSPAFRRFEGRLCSHSLALQYEANSRGMFGREVSPDTSRPEWQQAHSPVVVQYDKAKGKDLTRRAVPPGNMKRTFSTLDYELYESPELIELHHAPIYASVQQMVDAGERLENIIEMMASFSIAREASKEMLFEALFTNEQADNETVKARDLSDHDRDSADHSLHRTDDSREHAPHWGWGFPQGSSVMRCTQCNGVGCGHCSGKGQIATQQDQTLNGQIHDTPDQSPDAGNFIRGNQEGEPLEQGSGPYGSSKGPEDPYQKEHTPDVEDDDGKAVHIHIHADYSANDPLSSINNQSYSSPTPHSNTKNPASTGWATGQDPLDWGKSMLSNSFGLTSDAALVHPLNADDNCRMCGSSGTLNDSLLCAHCNNRMKAPGGEGGEQRYPGAYGLGPEHITVRPELMPSRLRALNTLHEGPEAALPFTDGSGEDQPTSEWPGNSGSQIDSHDADSIRQAFLQTKAAKALAASIPKTAMKDFTFAEQQDLINEGAGERARNFGDLQITGTHYEMLGDDIDENDLFI